MASLCRVGRAVTVLLVVGLGSALIARLAAPAVLGSLDDLEATGAEPAAVVSSAVTLTAAAGLALVACWVTAATTWYVVSALWVNGAPHLGRTHPLLTPWLVRVLVGAALGSAALAAPAAATTPPLPRALSGLPLPDRPSEAAPAPAAAPGPGTPTPTTDKPAPEPSPSRPPERTHTVVAGESLWSIAADHLAPGAPTARVDHAWRALYDANRPRLGDDPDLIRPGTVLRLPRTLV